MRPHFNPNRQGAAYTLDAEDVVLVGGTPRYLGDGESVDTRIRVGRSGFSERACWISRPDRVPQPKATREFHLWCYRLDAVQIARIDAALFALAKHAGNIEQSFDPNNSFRILRFWHRAAKVELFTCEPDGLALPKDYLADFTSAWNLIDAAVPPGA